MLLFFKELLLVCGWPILLGLIFVLFAVRKVKVDALESVAQIQKWLLYLGVVFVVVGITLIWSVYVSVEVFTMLSNLVWFIGLVWPFWVGLLLVLVLAWGIKIDAFCNSTQAQRWVLYLGIVVFIGSINYGWFAYIFVQVKFVFASIGMHLSISYPKIYEHQDLIQRELWLRMIIPPTDVSCYSSETVCYLTSTFLRNFASSRIVEDRFALWQDYLINFLLLIVPIGLAHVWLLDFLMQRRIRRHRSSI